MRSSTLTATALVAVLGLTACTSEEPTPTPSTDEATSSGGTTTDDGLEGGPGTNGWMCQYASPDAVSAVAGEEPTTVRELVVQDDAEGWVCQVLVGGAGEQETVLTVSVLLGEEYRDAARARAESADGAEPGPAYLGVSFLSPGLVTGLTLCTAPDAARSDDRIPYTLVAESLAETGEDATDALRATLGEAARSLDQGLGCSPQAALAEDAATTTAP
ncbi:hypothetical protein [Ornithinimicrobium sp. LYQ103]|uniref:hypothetical protein n=1 Tax=Ornithinimicrobium sp. LYQ103 TaxID=3378796 RepID=UPI003851E06A